MLETTDKSRELAAQAWCRPETSHIEMDVVLAQAFAEILDEQANEIVSLKLDLAASEKKVDKLNKQWEDHWELKHGTIKNSNRRLRGKRGRFGIRRGCM